MFLLLVRRFYLSSYLPTLFYAVYEILSRLYLYLYLHLFALIFFIDSQNLNKYQGFIVVIITMILYIFYCVMILFDKVLRQIIVLKPVEMIQQ